MVWHQAVTVVRATPDALSWPDVLAAHRAWHVDEVPMQLHPGDLGWQQRFGLSATVAAVRTWSRDDEVLAVGFLDEPTLLRLAVAPAALGDEELSAVIVADLDDLIGTGDSSIEVSTNALVHELLVDRGWVRDMAWTQLRLDLREPVPSPGLRIEVVGRDRVAERVAVQRAAFDRSTFTVGAWEQMAAGPAYRDARCLLAYDEDVPVAAVTVWSAGPGRPGLLEPLGVHHDHRGRGHGRTITLAAAAALRELGSSSAFVCTPSANVGGVRTYLAAGYEQVAEVFDLARPV